MEDFEILDLMETLEVVGHGRKLYIKVNGSFVPRVIRTAYTFSDNNFYVCYDTSFSNARYGLEVSKKYYRSTVINEYGYSVDFSVLFEESFGDKIRSMGEEYEYFNSGNKELTIGGPESGIIKLQEEIKMKFPDVSILKIE